MVLATKERAAVSVWLAPLGVTRRCRLVPFYTSAVSRTLCHRHLFYSNSYNLVNLRPGPFLDIFSPLSSNWSSGSTRPKLVHSKWFTVLGMWAVHNIARH